MNPDRAAATPLESAGAGVSDNGLRLDVEKLVQLRELLGDAFSPLVASFIANSALYVAQIEAAVGAADLTQAVAIAHKLKSSAAQFGLPDLAKAAERVEKLEAAEHLPALKALLGPICGALHARAAALGKGEARQ